MMKQSFGILPSGAASFLYTISSGRIKAAVTDLGATLVNLWVDGVDVVLGYDNAQGYLENDGFLGAIVGRNANRIQGAQFPFQGTTVHLTPNEGENNLHSGPDCWNTRLWTVESHRENAICLSLISPHGDQGFPGEAQIRVTYTLEQDTLTITYEAKADRDTVFNLTNHSYFNLFGADHPDLAMSQELELRASHFLPDDAQNIPTGEIRNVTYTPFDFRQPKALGRDIGQDYEPLHLQGGYDHHFVADCPQCAILSAPGTGRTMRITTDCPGLQVYSGNYLRVVGKGHVPYPARSGVCLETQFPPDCLHHPQWPQSVVPAGQVYHSQTKFQF